MNPNIFREYDIRGRVPEDLNNETMHKLGLALGTYFYRNQVNKIALGMDCRESSPQFKEILIKALNSSGIDVMDVGMVPTPLLYFALFHLNLDGGLQLTASHNPPEYNGLKVCLGKTTIYGEEIKEIYRIAKKGVFHQGKGSTEKTDIKPDYIDMISENITPGPHKIKVIVDAGNGVGGLVGPDAYSKMGMEVKRLFCEPDGKFPNHHPDPTVPENLHELIKRLKLGTADMGIAFDGDADRLGVIDRNGNIIYGDQLMVIFSRSVLDSNPGATIIGEVKCSQLLFDDIETHGGRAIMWKVGHSLIKNKMKEEKALLAGEMSGHIFFADRYYGYDDAIYAGARLLEILSHKGKDIRELISDLPHMVNTPEIRLDCPDEIKFDVVKKLAEEFKDKYRVIDIDGVRIIFEDGWGLIRPSNTQPVLVLRFEANSKERVDEIQSMFMERLNNMLCRYSK